MKKKRRRLSRQQRAAISAGLKRHYAGQRAAKRQARARRSRAAKAGWAKRKAIPELRRMSQTKEVAPPLAPAVVVPSDYGVEWEVTARYRVRGDKHHGETIDITMRIMGKPGVTYTREQIRAAAWYALKHGVRSLTDVTVAVVDWTNTRRNGSEQEYHYDDPQMMDEALENARGVFYRIGIGALRVDPVEQ